MRRKLFTAVAATFAGLAFTGTAHADNVNLNTAGAKCSSYANGVMKQMGYVRWERNKLTQAFAGHSHYTRCTIKYDTAGTRYSKNWACTETIDIYMLPHDSDRNRTIFMNHLTDACGYKVLRGPRP
jgi:hypothetical protein